MLNELLKVRVSGARTIIRAGRGPDALRLCARRN